MDSFKKHHTLAIRLVLCGVLLVLVHAWLIAPVIQNGDSAVYNEQIEQRVLGMRTTHVGYMLLGIVANTILPFGVERNLNLMSLIFAAMGAVAVVSIARKRDVSWSLALMAALLTLGLLPYLHGAVLAEVDVVACGLILLSVAAWLHDRTTIAGISYGCAMLTTPLAALSLPIFLLGPVERGSSLRRWLDHVKRLAIFGVVSTVTYLPLVLAYWQDYWHGGRGILHAPRQPWSMTEQLMRSVHFFTSTSGPWLILGLAGLLVALFNRSRFACGTAAAILVTAVVGERFLDVPVQLTHVCLLTVFAVSFVSQLPGRMPAACLVALAWLLTAIPTYLRVTQEVETRKQRRATYLEMARQTPKCLVAGLASSWDEGLPFERIVYHKTKLGLGLDSSQFIRSATLLARTRSGYAIWLLAPMHTGVMNPFASKWHRETRIILGRSYEVWLPISTPSP